MKNRLDEAVRGVPADTLPADDDLNLDLADDLGVEDPTLEGDPSDDDDEPGDGKGKRTIENVRGELLRKMQKSNQELMDQLRSMQQTMQEMNTKYGVPAPAGSPAARTLDDLSISELEAMKGTVPAEQKDAFLEYLQERKIDAKVSERIGKETKATERRTTEQRFNATAVERWPQLRDRSSEFYRVADRILSEMPFAADNPRAVLDAANEAGLELGLAPSTGLPRGGVGRRTPGSVAPGRRTSSGPGGGDDAVDVESMREISGRLRDAMPGHKFTKEQLARIAKRQRQYADTLHTRVRG